MHQARVHLASAGHPVVGDTDYGSPPAPRLMLHAWKTIVPDPETGAEIAIEAPLPPEMSEPPEPAVAAVAPGSA